MTYFAEIANAGELAIVRIHFYYVDEKEKTKKLATLY